MKDTEAFFPDSGPSGLPLSTQLPWATPGGRGVELTWCFVLHWLFEGAVLAPSLGSCFPAVS